MPYCNLCAKPIKANNIHCTDCSPAHSKSVIPAQSKNVTPAQSKSVIRQPHDKQSSNIWNPNTITHTMRDPSLHYYLDSVTANPKTGSVTATMNNQRTQCSCCHRWFGDNVMLKEHKRKVVRCSQHHACFTSEDNVVHASRHRHDRCFVEGCRSRFRIDEGWRNGEIVRHVREEHTQYR